MSTEKEFLPQYAAQAVVDLERTKKRFRQSPFYQEAMRQAAEFLRTGVHVVLPPNGEIYRDNSRRRVMPSPDECESFTGLPAPVTCFEYPWSHVASAWEGDHIEARKRITIVCDSKQLFPDLPADHAHTATFVSLVLNERIGAWWLLDSVFSVVSPLCVQAFTLHNEREKSWGVVSELRSLTTGMRIDERPLIKRLVGQWCADLCAVVQCCHALRAGAWLEEKTENSAMRRWKFEKKGVGGFTYHVLRLPSHADRAKSESTNEHASPRLHIRRAHIRKLPTGSLTFVRQCWVGDEARGRVQKHYQLRAS